MWNGQVVIQRFEESVDENEDVKDMDEKLETLEKTSWEELRLTHREIEVQVNEEELNNMEDYNVDDRDNEPIKGSYFLHVFYLYY